MGDIRPLSEVSSKDSNVVAVDAYALVQAILGRPGMSEKARSVSEDSAETLGYDQLPDIRSDLLLSDNQGPRPDDQPKDVRVGCVNPYALVEAIIGRRIDRNSVNSSQIISQVLQTDYDELFDMKNRSVLYAGLRLMEKERRAEQLTEKDMRILNERDLITPDLSRVQRLDDLEQIGLKGIADMRVKHARMSNGKIRLVIDANTEGNNIARQVNNREVTMTLNELITPFRGLSNGGGGDGNKRRDGGKARRNDDDDDNGRNGGGNRDSQGNWVPPNASWRDMYDYFNMTVNRRLINDVTNFRIGDGRRTTNHFFDDPTQGATCNSWLIAALFSVFWADPACINRATRVHSHMRDSNRNEGRDNNHDRLRIRFHDKGGNNNNRTEVVEVNYEIPITNSNNEPVYARASDGADIWPSLYEKAFAKWILGSKSDRPDITSTHSGDPVKAMAQINGREPMYYRTDGHESHELLGVVRQNCVNNKTINPMTAWTHATGRHFRGSNIVANHAYSVLGYAIVGDRQYIVMRNPWGVTEAAGLTSYPGLLGRLDPELWQPAELLDQGGLFALETQAFKESFAYLGCARDRHEGENSRDRN